MTINIHPISVQLASPLFLTEIFFLYDGHKRSSFKYLTVNLDNDDEWATMSRYISQNLESNKATMCVSRRPGRSAERRRHHHSR